MNTTIRNEFHGTEVTVRGQWLDTGDEYDGTKEQEMELTRSQIGRADRKLCGIASCRCGGIARLADGLRFEQIGADTFRLVRWVRA